MELLPKGELHAIDLLRAALDKVESCRNDLLTEASCSDEDLVSAALRTLDVLDYMLTQLDNEGDISLGSRVIS